jgi:hypothetical protein
MHYNPCSSPNEGKEKKNVFHLKNDEVMLLELNLRTQLPLLDGPSRTQPENSNACQMGHLELNLITQLPLSDGLPRTQPENST